MYSGHIEPGMRLEISKEAFGALTEQEFGYQETGIGIVGAHYSGEYFLNVKGPYWKNIAINFGQLKTTRHWMSNDEIVKQGFVDALLKGYSLNIDLQKVGWNWLVTVVNNLLNPDRKAAFDAYWAKKDAAGTVAKAKRANWKTNGVVKAAEKDGASDRVVAKAAEMQEKATCIYVKVGNNPMLYAFEANVEKDGEILPVLATGCYHVVNTRGARKLESRNYTGTEGSKGEFKGYAVMGYSLVAC